MIKTPERTICLAWDRQQRMGLQIEVLLSTNFHLTLKYIGRHLHR